MATVKLEKPISRHVQEFNGKTVVDILNKLKQNKNLYKMVMNKK